MPWIDATGVCLAFRLPVDHLRFLVVDPERRESLRLRLVPPGFLLAFDFGHGEGGLVRVDEGLVQVGGVGGHGVLLHSSWLEVTGGLMGGGEFGGRALAEGAAREFGARLEGVLGRRGLVGGRVEQVGLSALGFVQYARVVFFLHRQGQSIVTACPRVQHWAVSHGVIVFLTFTHFLYRQRWLFRFFIVGVVHYVGKLQVFFI